MNLLLHVSPSLCASLGLSVQRLSLLHALHALACLLSRVIFVEVWYLEFLLSGVAEAPSEKMTLGEGLLHLC